MLLFMYLNKISESTNMLLDFHLILLDHAKCIWSIKIIWNQ